MDLELLGKTAIVTGGSRGIGRAIARELALEGVDVAIAALNPGRLEAAARDLSQETGRRIVPIPVDTGEDESVRDMVRTAADAFGHLDILVNCAAQPGGVLPPASLSEITGDLFWPDMNIKVMGYLRCARETAPYMIRGGWGRIINISGLAARQSGNIIGSMRNVAVVAMTKNLADELGPHGINVTVVHPGATRTERTPSTLENQAQRLGITTEEAEQRMAAGNSVRRFIDAREIAFVVAFLASPKSIAINGDVIAAGGGSGRAIHY
jgi:NAD(P)-dependent dehydrogenase (short-subunit alcohol dehydrogenase family)